MEQSEASTNSIPQLWNPSATANWSILFTPIFGAWLQARNWDALGEKNDAKKSMIWVYAGVALLLILTLMSSFLSPQTYSGIEIFFLLVWYFCYGRKQIKYVKRKGTPYQKKFWRKPLLIALGCVIACHLIDVLVNLCEWYFSC